MMNSSALALREPPEGVSFGVAEFIVMGGYMAKQMDKYKENQPVSP